MAAYRRVDDLVTCGLIADTRDQLRAQRSVTSMVSLYRSTLQGTAASGCLDPFLLYSSFGISTASTKPRSAASISKYRYLDWTYLLSYILCTEFAVKCLQPMKKWSSRDPNS